MRDAGGFLSCHLVNMIYIFSIINPTEYNIGSYKLNPTNRSEKNLDLTVNEDAGKSSDINCDSI